MEDKTAEVNTTSEVQPAPDPALLRPDTSATSSFPSLELRQPSDASDASTLRPGLHSESSVAGASSSQASSTRSLLSSFSRPGRIFRKAGTGVKRQGSANGPTPLSASLTSTLWPVWSDSHKHDIDSRPDFAKTLDALGYPESLKREHDAWSLGAISLCNIGFLQGSL